MILFTVLLDSLITERGWTRADFAARIKMTPGSVSSLFAGRHRPQFRRGKQWADAFGLEGKAREEFLDSMAIASAVSRVATIVARLERKCEGRRD